MKPLEELDFGSFIQRLENKVDAIRYVQSSVALAVYSLLKDKDRKAAQKYYRTAVKVAAEFNTREMPEMYELLRKLKKEYKFK